MKDISESISEEIPKAFKNGELPKNRDFTIPKLAKFLEVDVSELLHVIKEDFGSVKEFYNFLGFGKYCEYVSYYEAQEICTKRGILYSTDFYKRWRSELRDLNIPGAPYVVYTEWTGWKDFLQFKYVSLSEFKEIVRAAKVNTSKDYRVRFKKEFRGKMCHSNPEKFYDNWVSWNDVLGKGATNVLPIKKLKAEIKKIIPKNEELLVDWFEREAQNRNDFPKSLHSYLYKRYKRKFGTPSEFLSEIYRKKYGEFEGRVWSSVEKSKFSYEEAREICINNGISTTRDYEKNAPKLKLPSEPNTFYSEWVDWYTFFKKEKRQKQPKPKKEFPYVSYEVAKRIVKEKKIKTRSHYMGLYNGELKGLGLPKTPESSYGDKWEGWLIFLSKWPSYEEARKICIENKVTGQALYWKVYKRLELHSSPDRFYKKEWKGWRHYLGAE